jgi:hypothetical protein
MRTVSWSGMIQGLESAAMRVLKATVVSEDPSPCFPAIGQAAGKDLEAARALDRSFPAKGVVPNAGSYCP